MHKLEKTIEKESKRAALKLKWFSFKLLPFLMNGLPDQCFIGHGRVVFIEFKREGQHPSPIQKVVIKLSSPL